MMKFISVFNELLHSGGEVICDFIVTYVCRLKCNADTTVNMLCTARRYDLVAPRSFQFINEAPNLMKWGLNL